MTIYFIDGFDLVDYFRSFLKYIPGYSSQFDQGQMIAGNGGGQALNTFNSAFSANGVQYTKLLGTGVSTLGIHIDYQQGGGTVFAGYDWYRLSIGSSDILTITQRTDGKLDFFGPGRARICTTVNPLVFGSWSNLIVLLSFGSTGSIRVLVNGVDALSPATQPFNSGAFFPTAASFMWKGGFGPGISVDNYFLFDGLTNPGPCHVDSTLPFADSPATVWTPFVTSPDVVTPNCTPMVNDTAGRLTGGAPDGDYTYISPSAVNNQLFQMFQTRCYGLILGVALNVCGRPNTGFSPQEFGYVVQLSQGLQSVGAGQLLNVGAIASDPHLTDYQTEQVVMPLSPATGTNWTDAEISNGAFGVAAVSGNLNLRVTAFNLEKITSLMPQPFNCGGSNYSY